MKPHPYNIFIWKTPKEIIKPLRKIPGKVANAIKDTVVGTISGLFIYAPLYLFSGVVFLAGSFILFIGSSCSEPGRTPALRRASLRYQIQSVWWDCCHPTG